MHDLLHVLPLVWPNLHFASAHLLPCTFCERLVCAVSDLPLLPALSMTRNASITIGMQCNETGSGQSFQRPWHHFSCGLVLRGPPGPSEVIMPSPDRTFAEIYPAMMPLLSSTLYVKRRPPFSSACRGFSIEAIKEHIRCSLCGERQ